MLKNEKNYDFRTELRQVHKKDRRNFALKPREDELEIRNGVCIILPKEDDDVIYTAARDFADYLLVSMGVGAAIVHDCPSGCQKIELSISKSIGEANGYMGYSITANGNSITVEGYDSRGVMQGLFFIEDIMNIRKAPFIKYGNIKRKALFDMRMVQSPMGMFDYTDEALSLMAHYGYDTIDVWIKDAHTTLRGDYIDLRSLSERAEKYGLRINIELYKVHAMHPDESGAQEYYDNMYGEIFEVCPKLGSIILEGEANHFVSRDPNACIDACEENIPTGKYKSGWWPCTDYPEFAQMIINAVRKYSKDTQILFCTYNWGFAPEEDRIKLIENLPDDLTVLATWDMFHQFRNVDSVSNIPDYSLRFIGPGEYFTSEAIACKKRGMKIASISNTAGKTWDFGVIPYEPAPERWIERFKRIIKANKEWGLCGLEECIHYGFYPSIISDLSKWAFFTEIKPLEEVYEELLCRDYEENASVAQEAFSCISEAIATYPISNVDQYGAFRIGPAYPLWLNYANSMPAKPYAMFKSIYVVPYIPYLYDRTSPPGALLPEEIDELNAMVEILNRGIALIENTPNANDKLLRLANLAKYMRNTCITVRHTKELFILKNKLNVVNTREETDKILEKIETLYIKEKENVIDTIPIVRCDSTLGWEPSMEYTGDEEALLWKIRQLDYEINYTVKMAETGNKLVDTITNKE